MDHDVCPRVHHGKTMRITKLQLKNFRLFKNMDFQLASPEVDDARVVVFIGNNGAGKTSVLEALSHGLSWLAARIKRDRSSGSPINDLAITNGESHCTIATEVAYGGHAYAWTLAKNLKGRKRTVESSLASVTELAEVFHEALNVDQGASIPLLAYYPVERSILDIPLKIRTRHSFGQFDGLDGALQQGVNFRRFFEWFREREDSESEVRSREMAEALLARLREENLSREAVLEILHTSLRDRQLNAVRKAISLFMPGLENLRIERRPRLRMMVDKDDRPLNVEQLSQGEKSLMALVGSIASRLSMMNPGLADPLTGNGIVMIDEVDLHLHPRWQVGIVEGLRTAFPNCQFILTTHSPLVVSQSRGIHACMLDNGEIRELGNLYGLDANQVLLQEMGVGIRNENVQNALDEILDLIQAREFPSAHERLRNLEEIVSEDHWELNKIRILLLRKEAQCAKNFKG